LRTRNTHTRGYVEIAYIYEIIMASNAESEQPNGSGSTNPVDASELRQAYTDDATLDANPQQEIMNGDSATTKAEKIERHGAGSTQANGSGDFEQPAAKRVKLDQDNALTAAEPPASRDRVKGVTPIKSEYLIPVTGRQQGPVSHHDDDAAEAAGKSEGNDKGGKNKKKGGGQNKARQFGSSRDALALCASRTHANEFSPAECKFGSGCKYEHDLRRYLKEGKREDLKTFDGQCPIFEARGKCTAGWRCRFASAHSEERDTADGRKELVLVNKSDQQSAGDDEEDGPGVVNVVSAETKIKLRKKQLKLDKSEKYTEWLNKRQDKIDKAWSNRNKEGDGENADGPASAVTADIRATYIEPPFRPSEKRRIYYGPETPILSPLTTVGNLPFRRLCVSLGAQVTWSEMAMGMPLIQGEKSEWALLKAHESETKPPAYTPQSIVANYDNSKDMKFGAQIAGNKPWLATKAAEVITALCPNLRAIDLNCGCPIDLVFRQGAGSALLDNQGRMEKILRGMNAVSNEIPITVKIRMGTKDNAPNADKLIQRLVLGGGEAQDLNEGPAGIAGITLHGRSRQQRYTRDANWEYIASCASLIKNLQKKTDEVTDTIREPDARDQSNSHNSNGQVYFIGNGDVYSHEDYNTHLRDAKVDAVMAARGALVKPWIFEEFAAGQYLDKSGSERLRYIEQFARNGLEYWGSDEIGVGTTRRFLLEWLSFSCRYVPVGLLERLPPRLGDRPPAYKGRDDLETLLCSPNYKDWIKIRYVFHCY